MDTFAPGGWRFDNSYARLPQRLFVRQAPVRVARPRLLLLNHALARELGLDTAWLESDEGVAMMAGNVVVPGSDPIAQAYAGHQFGYFTLLGDGRALLLGEHCTPDGRRFDIQLKGAGRTSFSRSGDGRAAVGPMVREYVISEAMSALGIPTTRSLAVIGTGEKVLRREVLDGAILVRVAASHIRVGTFEFAAAEGDPATLRSLLDYTIRRHYPEMSDNNGAALALLEAVAVRQAALVARWMLVGFVHGVMNTDNMALSGETIDYGPCAFIDTFDPATVFSSIDHNGRYAFGNQPAIAQWNLARFAETLLPMIASDTQEARGSAEEVITRFPQLYEREWTAGMRAKLGLTDEHAGDKELIDSLLELMHRYTMDYTGTFRLLMISLGPGVSRCPESLEPWRLRWLDRIDTQPGGRAQAFRVGMQANPAVIPRNHLVEEALGTVVMNGDGSLVRELLGALAHPYESGRSADRYERGPGRIDPDYRTFCGT